MLMLTINCLTTKVFAVPQYFQSFLSTGGVNTKNYNTVLNFKYNKNKHRSIKASLFFTQKCNRIL